MAHHDSTDPRVLAAPTITRTWVSSQRGLNREERRHSQTPTGGRVFDREWRLLSTNVPYRRPRPKTLSRRDLRRQRARAGR